MKYFIYCRKSQEAEDRQIMSLESQADEIAKLLDQHPDTEIVGRFEESQTAKTPGRPQFNEMIERIEAGEADGIISWHPDRLARNSIDGGRIIYALDQGALKDLLFCSYSFENDPQGKFMLNISFGYSKYYVDNLSINVKRGLQTKLKNGWKPNLAPIGYRNCKETRTIIPDRQHFKAVRGMFELLLQGGNTPSDIHRTVCNEWAYTTPLRNKTGGKAPALSTVYKILANPFYAGFIRWKGQLYSGSHIPIVTKSEFDRAQSLLSNVATTKQKALSFPYTGLFKCGACGLSITAERKWKPSGKRYEYYHCTRKHRTPKCTEPAINGVEFDKQICEFLDRIVLPSDISNWLINAMSEHAMQMASHSEKIASCATELVKAKERQLSNLTDLRIRDILSQEEFDSKRSDLQIELAAAKENALETSRQTKGLEPVQILGMFNTRAKDWYSLANDRQKRRLLNILCQNPSLKDRKALLFAKKPFVEMEKIVKFHDCAEACKTSELQLADIVPITREQIKKLHKVAADPETVILVSEIRAFIHDIDPNALTDLNSVMRI